MDKSEMTLHEVKEYREKEGDIQKLELFLEQSVARINNPLERDWDVIWNNAKIYTIPANGSANFKLGIGIKVADDIVNELMEQRERVTRMDNGVQKELSGFVVSNLPQYRKKWEEMVWGGLIQTVEVSKDENNRTTIETVRLNKEVDAFENLNKSLEDQRKDREIELLRMGKTSIFEEAKKHGLKFAVSADKQKMVDEILSAEFAE